MLPVSTDYPAAIRKRRDRIIRSRVEITWTDPQQDQSIQVTSNSQANISWLNHVADGREEPSFKYAALDGTWVLDGTYHLAPDTPEDAFFYQMGWWSGKLSDANGEFSAPYPRITIRMAPQTVLGLRIVGDSKRGEWLVDFDVYLYRGSQLVHVEEVRGNADIIFETALDHLGLYDISRITIDVRKISHPGRHAKIVEAFTSMKEIYEGKDIAYLSVLEEREISNDGSLPIGHMTSNELVVQLINLRDRFNPGNIFSAYHNLLKLNRKVRAWIGPKLLGRDVVEYKPMGTFWVKAIDVAEDSYYVTFTCQDMLQLLSDTDYNCPVVYNANLYDQAVAVLEDARTVLGLPNEEFYWVDPELQDIVIEWFFLETMSHREALRRIVERALGQGYVSRKNIIRVEGVSFIKPPEGS